MRKTCRVRGLWRPVLLASLLGACMGMGWEEVLTGAPFGGDVRGEVSWVDTRRREIGVSGGWGGRETVRYDSRTRVVYRQREYRVRDLERGDLVTIDVEGGSRGRRYARLVRVERSGRDSNDRYGNARRQRFDGRIVWVDRRSGQFSVEVGRTDYVVTLPARANRETVRRFERLRRGDRTRFEAEVRDRGRVLLIRFL